ncbi:MAG TPA: TRAP transporter TatT component family protein [Bacteroidota bacterium]|nr:TRAP transporter TatT component family protein [Bacteroidota bacterium]
MRKGLIFLAAILAVPLSGCLQQIAVSSLGGIMENGFTVLNEEQDLALAELSGASNLKLLEAVLKSDPDNEHYLLLASEGYSSYALAFAEDDSADRARLLYLRGKSYGMKILLHHKEFADAASRSVDEFSNALHTFSRGDVPAVFWTAVGWGSAIGLSLTDPSAIADLPKVEAMMKFVADNDSSYFYGGGYFFLGTLAGSRPSLLGGDTARSRSYFDRCLAVNKGNFLMTYVYLARSYAVQTQNRGLFEECLTRVDTASIDILPEARLSNAVAKKKAHLLRARIDQLF